MIFHENRLLADDSHVISYLILSKIGKKMSQNLSSTAVVIGALRVKSGSGFQEAWGVNAMLLKLHTL